MPIDFDISRVARLARLSLPPEDLARLQGELEDILTHAARVQALATDDVAATSHPLPMRNNFRQDEIVPSLDRDEVLAAAPEAEDGYFRVPRILEDEA